ncbi:hypothetical protein PRZ48_009075 [Zasmidium cellare]|uniref:Uncharacterized protein n=1 Tax=Zasmidium cellare TaxID=395010 RepID=A0ABR0EI60_ZASCE|nr:hypothetical protein PRZ48_009075 [Zasmidium cellare]
MALAGSVAAQQGDILYGTQCCYDGWQHCQDQGSWGCIQINGGGPNCVNQTPNCDDVCISGYAYQKDRSTDPRCICPGFQDANQPLSYC